MRKYLMYLFAAAALLAALHPLRAFAAADEVHVDETGAVSIVSEHAAEDEISSLQLEFSVDSADGTAVAFSFNTSTKVQDYRYDGEKKVLSVYLAGTKPLFAQGSNTLEVGKIVVLDGSGKDAGAVIRLVEGSLQYVYGTEVREMEDLEVPGEVYMGPSPQPTQEPLPGQPTEEPSPGQPTQAPQTPGPDQGGNSNQGGSSDQGGNSGQGGSSDQGGNSGQGGSSDQGGNSSQGNVNQGGTGQGSHGGTGLGTGASTGSSGTQGGGHTSQGSGSQGGSSQGGGSQGGSSQGGSGSKESSVAPEASPQVSSPTPESGTPEPEEDSSISEPEEESSSAPVLWEEGGAQEDSSKGIDWIFVLAVAVIVLAVAAAAAAVAVLGRKPKQPKK